MRIRPLAATATAALALVSTLAVATPAEAASTVQLTRIQYDSPGTDDRSAGSLNAEYVTIRNSGSRAVSLRGYTLRDAQRHVYTFGGYTLAAGASVRIHTGRGTNGSAHRYWGSGAYIWNNTGDTATLRNAAGASVDSCTWRSAGRGYLNC
ncbi:lamin tail domain-containing protein [Marinactinospora rubrisoli]|uniref:Lamin tail domain-containing protein n=1 Tax=Marinactinospora rubrisoli TaxID=2715399 RepID=A0ABW2KB15_9ACTN